MSSGSVDLGATIGGGGGGGSGTVTSVSVVSANGLAGTVANPTTTPAITLSTSITGVLKGNGTAVAAASTTGTGDVVLATTPTFVTNITDPLIIGGTGTTSALTLRSTSGVGTTGADIIVQAGNNGATEVARFTNSGLLGIGVNNPGFTLDILGSANLNFDGSSGFGTAYSITDTTNTKQWSFSMRGVADNRDSLKFYYYDGTNYTNYFQINASNTGAVGVGNLGLGTPSQPLDVYGNQTIDMFRLNGGTTGSGGNQQIGICFNPTNGGDIQGRIGCVNAGAGLASLTFETANAGGGYVTSERMRIQYDGKVGIGTIAPSAQLHTTSTVRFANFGAGAATFDASGNVSSASDIRLKDVQREFTTGLAAIKAIDPIIFKWNAFSGMEMDHEYAGFSAQNVEAAIPEAVGKDNKGFLSIQDRALLAAAINAIKELDKRLTSLGV